MIPLLFLSTFLFILSAPAVPVSEQRPLGPNKFDADEEVADRPTDVHPDLYYTPGTSANKACHRGKGTVGYFGAQGTECDSPFTLVNETFRWIEENLKDQIDFVIWTGDSARHDNDEAIPRTEDQVVHLNEIIAGNFIEVFYKKDSPRGLSIPVVPTIGNNDIMPHNILKAGPNRWTKKFSEVWARFIPETQRHTFVEGGWFTSEVIPGKLAVLSLNTMYFYESNSAVDGCKSKSEPGFEQMEWLRIQLQMLRTRRMKAILMGHVPPARSGAKRSWDETCWQKYALWLHQYRDVVVGSAYGHMNIDHFMFQDSHKVKIADTTKYSASSVPGGSLGKISIYSRSAYLSSLREDWSKLPSPPRHGWPSADLLEEWLEEDTLGPDEDSRDVQTAKKKKRFLKKIGGPWAERYSVSLVSPSLVPNYFPTLRVVEYNITGLEDAVAWTDTSDEDINIQMFSDTADDDVSPKTKKRKKNRFKVPEPPSASAPPGPAYSNQPLTWLGYTQYFANLTRINNQMSKVSEWSADTEAKDNVFSFEVEYDTRDDHIYKMKDLTVRSFFKLATRIAENYSAKSDSYNQAAGRGRTQSKNPVWRAFLKRAFVGFLSRDELDDIET
ncbi:hypothetical protein EYZ11_002978 [Aspergillus tanneri]|uniref:Endopolyphosphatase n=1 Tax=Aspergillus tanneri TaxID=1220188 RepID=A0A4S3JPN4_9EURO|nr:Endopolyphosphatase [Aspergillus tanneri]KAA8651992.1 Endopolyphosphatase [Aspergillus tanneri]THC97555.1 hypothetical protein EYZ11_002978 [Aspergillus tanneri]